MIKLPTGHRFVLGEGAAMGGRHGDVDTFFSLHSEAGEVGRLATSSRTGILIHGAKNHPAEVGGADSASNLQSRHQRLAPGRHQRRVLTVDVGGERQPQRHGRGQAVRLEACARVVHVDRGGCLIEGGEENIDARLEEQLEAMHQVLRSAVFDQADVGEERSSQSEDDKGDE